MDNVIKASGIKVGMVLSDGPIKDSGGFPIHYPLTVTDAGEHRGFEGLWIVVNLRYTLYPTSTFKIMPNSQYEEPTYETETREARYIGRGHTLVLGPRTDDLGEPIKYPVQVVSAVTRDQVRTFNLLTGQKFCVSRTAPLGISVGKYPPSTPVYGSLGEDLPEPEPAFEAKADALTNARGASYGHPLDDFSLAYRLSCLAEGVEAPESDKECALLEARRRVMLKIARLATTLDHADSWADIMGYGRCGQMILEESERRATGD